MSSTEWGLTFDGPYADPEYLEPQAGVYVVWCESNSGWSVVDVGEAGNVQKRLLDHERADCWDRNCRGELYFAAHYTPHQQQPARRQIEERIRELTDPPCGER